MKSHNVLTFKELKIKNQARSGSSNVEYSLVFIVKGPVILRTPADPCGPLRTPQTLGGLLFFLVIC